jgi:hypothetical protein
MPVVEPIVVIRTAEQTPAKELGIGDVILQALGLTGGLLIASLLLGLAVGAFIIWLRKRQAGMRREGEAGDQIRLRLEPPTRVRV